MPRRRRGSGASDSGGSDSGASDGESDGGYFSFLTDMATSGLFATGLAVGATSSFAATRPFFRARCRSLREASYAALAASILTELAALARVGIDVSRAASAIPVVPAGRTVTATAATEAAVRGASTDMIRRTTVPEDVTPAMLGEMKDAALAMTTRYLTAVLAPVTVTSKVGGTAALAAAAASAAAGGVRTLEGAAPAAAASTPPGGSGGGVHAVGPLSQ